MTPTLPPPVWVGLDRGRGVIEVSPLSVSTRATRREHVTPLTEAAAAALKRAQEARAAIGDTWVLPSPSDEAKPVSRNLMRDW